jgi:hypothetical protein
MQNHYVYYSYEEFGRGYIGCRTCECAPEEDNYFGSYHDETFKPSHKIILETFSTREEALQAEVDLHRFYQVDQNPHFANKSRQKTTGFYYAEKKFGEENPFYGKIHSKETKEKISKCSKGRVGVKKYGENNPFYGKTHTEETKNLIRQKTIEQFKTLGHPFEGKKHSEKTKKKFRENNKGEKNPNFGKKQTEEIKEKVRLAKVGKKLWNNGKQQKFSKECPGEGWILGGLKTNKEV